MCPSTGLTVNLPSALIGGGTGIGDQVQFATIQQTAKQFNRRLCPQATTIPLGHFPASATKGNPVYILPEDPTLGFAEAYWADIPRGVAAGGYQLEETKHWASTVAARAAREHPIHGTRINFRLVSEVVGEMVETIATLQRLIFIANKAGVGKFDLDKILVDYVDDVQLVAEFGQYRTEIVGRFTTLMEKIATFNPNADIFVVAHSEGTVVAWLGILQALWSKTPPWLKQVKGLMTFGSPIDKHLVLWPELFRMDGSTDLRGTDGAPPVVQTEHAIQWKNYYDFGDPIGFELDTARYWLDQRGVKFFEFDQKQDDIGFARYLVPGAAHNDYWNDNEVFDHFIDTVVRPDEEHPKRPKNRFWAWPVSYLVSYGVCFLLILLGVWTVDHTLSAYSQSKGETNSIAQPAGPTNVAGLAATGRPTGDPDASTKKSAPGAGGADVRRALADAKNLLGIAALLAGITGSRSNGWSSLSESLACSASATPVTSSRKCESVSGGFREWSCACPPRRAPRRLWRGQ